MYSSGELFKRSQECYFGASFTALHSNKGNAVKPVYNDHLVGYLAT